MQEADFSIMMIGSNNTVNMTYNLLSSTNKALEKTTRALSTGLRAANASDDAAGFAISSSISAQVVGVDRAIRNSQDGISLLQTAEGGLEQINTTLHRMRELSVQAANDTLTAQDRKYIQLEIEELRKSIDNFASNTTFNGKRLLDGSSSAIWASDKSATKLKVSGAVTTIDEFGQKKRLEGNYRIDVKAKAGQGEVQKSAIFSTEKIQPVRDTTIYDYEIDITAGETTSGETSGKGWEFVDGVLTITGSGNYSIVGDADGTETGNRIVVRQGVVATIKLTNVNIAADDGSALEITGSEVKLVLDGENTLTGGGSESAAIDVRNSLNDGPKATLEINSVGGKGSEEGTLTASGMGGGAGIGGSGHSDSNNFGYSVGAITINGGTITATSEGDGAGIGGGSGYSDDEAGAHVNITINGGNITASGGGAGIGSGADSPSGINSVDRITINGGKITATGGEGSAAIGGGSGSNSGVIRINSGAELTLSGWVDKENGAEKSIGRGEGGSRNGNTSNAPYNDVGYFGSPDVTLEDIPQFYDASGVFLVKEPQTITITQGNGKSAEVVLYANDTIENVRAKLNDAIAFGLGQSEYTDNHENFVTFVETGKADSQGFETVEGTLVVRSAVAGNAGRLTIASENQDLTNALGFNVIQDAEENTFTASVYDAHNGKVIASNIDAAGNVLYGVFGENASIEFDSMANVKAHWDEGTKRYILSSEEGYYTTTLHIQDRSTSFQVGQSDGEEIFINIGDMTSEALSLNKVDVLTQKNAAKSITILDAAIHTVSVQRSRVGAYQNELEHNANSLQQASLQLQASESRIKDADMAREYMEFVKLQILNQTGNSMLSQAHQNARSLMSVLVQ